MNNLAYFTTGFAGIVMGVVLGILFYTVSFIKKTRDDYKKMGFEEVLLTDEIIEIRTKAILKYKKSKKNKSKIDFILSISKDINEEIAKVHYPDSQNAYAEISIEEIMQLNKYIIDRVNIIFTNKILKIVKSLRISTIIKGINIKKKLDKFWLYKVYISVSRKLKKVFYVINFFNPIYWARLFILKFGIKVSRDIINKEIINIVTEESYRVYSKSLFTDYEKE